MKSLYKYFSNLTITDDKRIAVKEIRDYLTENGFECSTISSYYNSPSNPHYKKATKVPILAKQLKSGKTIAIEIDNKSPRVRTVQKLLNVEADYKVVITRDHETEIGSNFISGGKIEKITLKQQSKVDYKLESYRTQKEQGWSSATEIQDGDIKQLYDIAYKFVGTIYRSFRRIPKYVTLVKHVKENHTALYEFIGQSLVEGTLKRVHNEARIYYNEAQRRGINDKKLFG
jgi:hypothetical protein